MRSIGTGIISFGLILGLLLMNSFTQYISTIQIIEVIRVIAFVSGMFWKKSL